MKSRIHRRDFLAVSAATGLGLALAGRVHAEPWKTKLHKAVIGKPTEENFRTWKNAGFEGVESDVWDLSAQDAVAARKSAESQGMKIHSILFGWGNLNGGDAALADSVAKMETALRTAQNFGSDAVLFVPCTIGGMPYPKPWEFDICFDEKTCHLKQVVAGDNAKFQQYIEAHNRSLDASRDGIRKLIPTAEKTGVVVAVENVWNNFCLKPDLLAAFIASFDSPWVKAYFDIGNHVRYAPPQDWIRTLGKLLVKCHAKDFKLNPDGHDGKFCEIREGSVDWPAVRKALDDIDYNGWMTIEGGDISLEESSKRLDLIIEGK